ncbi:MAG: hemoglobin/transferrin/lactoferrin receptor protein [Halieaceae bacterium]|jgi:hemoglobin/transferrin/lactoferrin receptor protein
MRQFYKKILVIALMCQLAPVTAATETQLSMGTRLEEVVVTAARREERVLDSPLSLSVINQDQLDRSTAVALADLLRDIPGVRVTDSGQPGMKRIRIRGEESRRTAILINSQEVTDHHEVGTPLTLHPSMVARVEMIRGSGAILYGSRALSGVVNFITKNGGDQPLEATFSHGYDGAADGTTSFVSIFGDLEGLEYRLAYSRSDYGLRNTPLGEVDNTAFDSSNIYLYLGKTVGAHSFDYHYEDYRSSSEIFVEEEVKTSYPLTDFYLDTPRRDRRKHSFAYSWELDSQYVDSFRANSYFQTSEREFYTRTETVWYERDIYSESELETRGALAQVNFARMGDHQLIGGIQYQIDRVDQGREVDTLSWTEIATSGTELIGDTAEIETWAWFLHDTWELTDRWVATLGLRQYHVSGELSSSDRESLDVGHLGGDNNLIAAFGAVWEYSDDMRLRLNVGEGYVYPSLMQLATGAYAGSRFVNPNIELKPETSLNYELGVRVQKASLTLDAAIFASESDDYIHHLPCIETDYCPGRRDRLYQNVGKSAAHGLEVYLAYTGSKSALKPYLNLTWIERRNTYAEFSTWDSGTASFSAQTGVRWEGSSATWGLHDAWIDMFARGESASSLKEPGSSRAVLEDKVGWGTINLAAGFDFGNEDEFSIALELHNLGDKTYVSSMENLHGIGRSVSAKFTADW